MYPILGRFGPFLLYSYEVVLGLGIFASVGLSAWLLREDSTRRPRLFDTLLIASLAAILGGRIIFVLSHWSYYAETPGDIWLVWRGGLSYHGALIFGLALIWLWTRWRKILFADIAKETAVILALMSVFGWFACLLEGCAFGSQVAQSLLSADLPDNYGVYAVRYQSQLLGMLLSTVVLVITLAFYRRLRPLQLFWLTMGMLSASRLIVTLVRGDEILLIGAFRLDTVVDAFILVASIVALVILWRSPSAGRSR